MSSVSGAARGTDRRTSVPFPGEARDRDRAADRRGPRPHVAEAHAAARLTGIEADPVVLDAELQAALRGIQRHRHAGGPRVPADVGQGFLGHPEDHVLRAGRETVARGEFAHGHANLRAGAKPERLALLLQRLDEAGVLQRRGPQLVEHRLHLGHRLACRLPNLLEGAARARGVGGESRLSRRRRRLDGEDLLLHRVVEIASQPVALLLSGRGANLLFVGGPEPLHRRLLRISEERRVTGKSARWHAVGRPVEVPEQQRSGEQRPERDLDTRSRFASPPDDSDGRHAQHLEVSDGPPSQGPPPGVRVVDARERPGETTSGDDDCAGDSDDQPAGVREADQLQREEVRADEEQCAAGEPGDDCIALEDVPRVDGVGVSVGFHAHTLWGGSAPRITRPSRSGSPEWGRHAGRPSTRFGPRQLAAALSSSKGARSGQAASRPSTLLGTALSEVEGPQADVKIAVVTTNPTTGDAVAGEDLTLSLEAYRALFDHAAEGIALHRLVRDASGQVIDYVITGVNPKYEAIVGLSRDQVVGRQGSEIYGVTPAPYLAEFSSAPLTGKPLRFETYFAPMDKHFSISVAPLGPDGFATIFFDVTETKRSQEKQETLSALVESSSAFTGLATLDGVVFYLNEAARRLAGVEADQRLEDVSIFDFIPQADRAWLADRVLPVVRSRGAWNGQGALLNLKTGASLRVDCGVFVIPSSTTGRPLCLAAVMHDITERERAREHRERLEDQLRQAQKMESVGRLAGGVAHDFNNLLTVILGNLESVLAALNPADPICQPLSDVQRAGESAASLTRQLLAFSRKQVIEPTAVEPERGAGQPGRDAATHHRRGRRAGDAPRGRTSAASERTRASSNR